MHRFVHAPLPAGSALSEVLELSDEESRHARGVLRLRVGEAVELLDGAGTVAAGVVAESGRVVRVKLSTMHRVAPLRPRVCIACAMPKGPRAADMVNQLSQLGVDELVPLRCERSVVDPGQGKVDRLGRAAVQSAKQCGRAWFMTVTEPMDFHRALELPGARRLLALAGGAELTTGDGADLRIFIGPEGGFTAGETQAAMHAGCVPVSLGPFVLRIETAAVAAAAILRRSAVAGASGGE